MADDDLLNLLYLVSRGFNRSLQLMLGFIANAGEDVHYNWTHTSG